MPAGRHRPRRGHSRVWIVAGAEDRNDDPPRCNERLRIHRVRPPHGRASRLVRGAAVSDWFHNHRLEWIRETVHIFGFINREHIERKFRVSTPQASKDLRCAMERWPLLMKYDTSEKRYVLI